VTEERVFARLATVLGGPLDAAGSAPGRINTIGGHTDYAEGLALAGAIDRRTTVGLRRRSGSTLELHALDLPAHAVVEISTPPGAPTPAWARTMWGAVEVFHRVQGLPPVGLAAAVCSTVPRGGGVSSSAALTVAWMAALAALHGLELAPERLARLAQEVEHRWLGVPCGLLDQLSSAAGQADTLLALDFRPPVAVEPVHDVLPGTAWLVLDTGVRRALADSAYRERVEQVRAGLTASGAAHWRQLSPTQLARVRDPVLQQRLRHVVTENGRVREAVAVARTGDAARFGRLMRMSHESLRRDFAVSCDELDTLVDLACTSPGVHGARMVGGGFGGCVLALVDGAAAERACARISQHTGSSAMVVRIGDGARGVRGPLG
jgi:galactokinase